jgi:hypothetical protein
MPDPMTRLAELARTFPSLARSPVLDPFDVERVEAFRRVCSHGECLAADFILHVYNRYEHRFDLGEAMNTWDDAHIAAFAAWARAPFYC